MTASVARQMVVHHDDSAFLQAAGKWTHADPFPLLAGPELERTARWLTDQSGYEGLPSVHLPAYPGTVMSCGGAASAAIAALLARATDRPHTHTAPERVLSELRQLKDSYVALVGVAEDIDAVGDWMGTDSPRLGVVTARGTAALAALVYRSLTVPFLPPAPHRRLVHPTLPDSQEADVIGFEDMGVLTKQRSDLVVLRSHGRECCVHLPDAILCGRSDAPTAAPEPAPTGRRIPACMTGHGCYKPGIEPEERIPAHDLVGSVVYMHSCDAISPGFSAMPLSVNFSLGVLEGLAVAVVGAIGRQRPDPHAERVLTHSLNSGLRLGDVVAQLNAHGAGVGGELSVSALLGDPAVAFPARGVEERDPPSIATTFEEGRGTPAPVPVPHSHIEAVQRITTDVLPRLESLRWADVALNDGELARAKDLAAAAARACLLDAHPDAERTGRLVRELTDTVASTQQRTLERLLSTAHSTWWRFAGPALSAYHQLDASPIACRHCGRASGRRIHLQHRTQESLHMTLHTCRSCGSWLWRTGANPISVEHRAPMDVSAALGMPLDVTASLVNNGSASVHGAAGFTFVGGGYKCLPKPTLSPIALEPGEQCEVRANPRLSTRVVPDLHDAVFVTLVDGVLTALPLVVNARRQTSGKPK